MTSAFPSLDRAASGEADLAVLCALAVRDVMKEVLVERAEAGQRIAVRYGTMGQLQALIADGVRADLAILSTPVFEAFENSGLLREGRELARTDIALVVRQGQQAPDISTSDKLRDALLAAQTIARTDPKNGGTAGVFLADLLARFGIAQAIDEKSRMQANGNAVAQCVADGAAEIGITLVSEIVPVAGAAVGAVLPPCCQCATTYAAGVFADSSRQDEARAFIALLAGPVLASRWTANGFT